jgi:hypothetical protein
MHPNEPPHSNRYTRDAVGASLAVTLMCSRYCAGVCISRARLSFGGVTCSSRSAPWREKAIENRFAHCGMPGCMVARVAAKLLQEQNIGSSSISSGVLSFLIRSTLVSRVSQSIRGASVAELIVICTHLLRPPCAGYSRIHPSSIFILGASLASNSHTLCRSGFQIRKDARPAHVRALHANKSWAHLLSRNTARAVNGTLALPLIAANQCSRKVRVKLPIEGFSATGWATEPSSRERTQSKKSERDGRKSRNAKHDVN